MDEEVDVLETLEDFGDEFGSLIDEPPMAGIFSADSLLSLTRVTSVGAEQKESPKSVFHEDSSSPYGVSASMLLGGKPIAQPPQNVMKLPSEGIKQQDNKPKQQPQLLRRPTPAFNIDFIAGSTRPITSFGQPTIIGNTPPSPSSSDKTEVKEKPDWAKSSEALDNEMRRRLEQAAEDTSKQKQKYVVDKQTLICHLAWCSRAKEIPKERQIRVDKVPYNGHYALCTTCFRSKTPEYQLNEFLKANRPVRANSSPGPSWPTVNGWASMRKLKAEWRISQLCPANGFLPTMTARLYFTIKTPKSAMTGKGTS